MKKKRRKAFWSNIKFKYRLTITNENTLEDIQAERTVRITLRVVRIVSHRLLDCSLHPAAQLPARIYEQ